MIAYGDGAGDVVPRLVGSTGISLGTIQVSFWLRVSLRLSWILSVCASLLHLDRREAATAVLGRIPTFETETRADSAGVLAGAACLTAIFSQSLIHVISEKEKGETTHALQRSQALLARTRSWEGLRCFLGGWSWLWPSISSCQSCCPCSTVGSLLCISITDLVGVEA